MNNNSKVSFARVNEQIKSAITKSQPYAKFIDPRSGSYIVCDTLRDYIEYNEMMAEHAIVRAD